jgi:SAM-dependent methyltransferase
MRSGKDISGNFAAFSSDMKRDWDRRARENAKWFINTFKLDQSDEEFYLTGQKDFEGLVLQDLALLTDRRDPKSLGVLEVGCGVGRMTLHFAQVFGEVYGVDVSADMIRLAKERLSEHHHIYFYETNGLDFAEFPNDNFDLIFSAFVFQHVPDPCNVELRETYSPFECNISFMRHERSE